MAANRLTACQTGNCLADNSLENRSRNIFTAGTFVNQRLNISFGKNTAASRNRVNSRSPPGQFIQTGSIRFQQSRHLVNKSTSTTGAGTIHSLLNTALEVSNLCIFTPQFNYNISLRNGFFYSSCSRNHFLYKRNIKPQRNRKTARTSYFYRNSLVFTFRKFFFNFIKSLIYHLNNSVTNISPVPFISPIQKFIIVAQNNNLYRCRTNINSHSKRFYKFSNRSNFLNVFSHLKIPVCT